MEENLRNLSSHLSEASSIISSIFQQNQATASRSTVSESATNDTPVNTALNRARAMLSSSISRGNFSRLNRRERLRATSAVSSSSSQVTSSKKKKENEEKHFEFVLVDVSKEDEDDWVICNDVVALRGLIEISTSSKEADIRHELGNAVRLKFPAVNDSDFEFLRATRRKLSKLVNCKGFDFKQLKIIAGQGAIYVKVKDGMECLLVESTEGENSDGDEKKENSTSDRADEKTILEDDNGTK